MKTITTFIFLSYLFSLPLFAGKLNPIIDGREWRQLTETRGFSVNMLDTIYDRDTGLLDTGTTTLANINGDIVDFDGWTWAHMDDLVPMFNSFPGLDFTTFFASEKDSEWGPAILEKFDYLYTDSFDQGDLSYVFTATSRNQPSWGDPNQVSLTVMYDSTTIDDYVDAVFLTRACKGITWRHRKHY